MDRPLTILLVEDDVAECRRFDDYIDGLEDVQLVATTNNAKQALEHATDCQPDAIILDLELHHGGGDGLSFLLALRRIELPYTPLVLVTTHNIHSMIHAQARRLGAAFIMAKTQEGYSAENVVDFLRDAREVIQGERQKVSDAPELPGEKQKRQQKKLAAEFDRLGISPKLLGRNYLIEYILLLIEDPSSTTNIIARKHGKTDKSVQNAMQNAINTTWANGDIEDLAKYYTARVNVDRGVPTTAEFVCHYRDKFLIG